ncbi:unnamed protein product [Adineta ricciae]|uniref:Uncharacterized protein n=1 Tax=Adineta ricciae TaxID=249248 RepID=A0A816F997_ADIRI|nr:unnamed protein product [Adineta ricciae]CAF1660049.1 unnamed protein product [Adineta ricciae]
MVSLPVLPFSTSRLELAGQTQLLQISEKSTLVRNESYVKSSYKSGYVNISGSLRVTYLDVLWTQASRCGSVCSFSTSMTNITSEYVSNLNRLTFSTENQVALGLFNYLSMFTVVYLTRQVTYNLRKIQVSFHNPCVTVNVKIETNF